MNLSSRTVVRISLGVIVSVLLAFPSAGAVGSTSDGSPVAVAAKKKKKKKKCPKGTHRVGKKCVPNAPAATTPTLTYAEAIAVIKTELYNVANFAYNYNGYPTYYELEENTCQWGKNNAGGTFLGCYGWVIQDDPFCAGYDGFGYPWNHNWTRWWITAYLNPGSTVKAGRTQVSTGLDCGGPYS